jgi:hypothetical protein
VRRTLTALLVLVLVLAVTGCAAGGQPAAPAATAPAVLTMPDTIGQNAAVAADALHKVGFTNIDLGTVDGRRMVLLPQNWTVKAQSAPAGARLAPDAKIVLGCARNGGLRWF